MWHICLKLFSFYVNAIIYPSRISYLFLPLFLPSSNSSQIDYHLFILWASCFHSLKQMWKKNIKNWSLICVN